MRSLFAFVCFGLCSQSVLAYDPTEKYLKREIQGYTVLISPEVEKHPDEAKAAFAELEAQLKKINDVVPEKPLSELKKIKFWIEWEVNKKGACEYHVSLTWLKNHGYNPDKAQGVEINNSKNFGEWSRKTQPWMILHELAHSYHFTVLGENYEPLQDAYKQAMERKLYDSVEFINGGKKKAYAATNPAEYFAELSEAYFGKNDFFPFTCEELEKHDPAGFAMMKKAWGTPRR
jgi:hypothetical protein